jgi:hypothetical protein
MSRSRPKSAFVASVVAVLVATAAASCRPAADPAPLGPEVRLVLRTQPANAKVGIPIGTPPVLEVLDRDDELIAATGMTVRATIVTGPGQIASGAEVSVVDGVANFSNLILVGTADGNIRLGFQLFQDAIANAEAVAAAETFSLQTGPATQMAAQNPATIIGAPGDLVTPPPSVILKDVSGNLVAGASVSFVVTGGEGRITGATESTTDAQGIATVSGWELGLPGANQLRAVAASREVNFNAAVTTAAGMLRVRLTGLPAGSTARVRVRKTSAVGAIHDQFYDIHDSLTVTGLPFGTYQITGDSVKLVSRIWLADTGPNNLNVSATTGPSVALNYRENGRFELTARGLPSPTQTATFDFLPTAGESAVLFAVSALNDAVTRGLGPVGTYDVVPRTVVVGGQQFAATPSRQTVVLSGGDVTSQMTFTYAITTGTLTVTLAGALPEGTAPQVDVTGPGGFHETVFISTPRTWNGLAPGTYTIVASPITVANIVFNPTPPTTVVSITAGVATPVTITYNQ